MSSSQPSPSSAVESLAHTKLAECYQCGKCSAGCPVGVSMDLLPNQLLRLVQLGRIDKALASESIWQCVSCWTCTTRCPKSVNCAGVMDALRQLAYESGSISSGQRRTFEFQKAFLDNIRRNGRLNEVELIGTFKTRTFLRDLSVPMLLKDSTLAPKLMARGKFHLLGEKVKDRRLVKRIFDRCLSGEHGSSSEVAHSNGRPKNV
ncbi:MAG: 4Fe-4S dicluster domain-containing protein [Planctomycetota bacterium]